MSFWKNQVLTEAEIEILYSNKNLQDLPTITSGTSTTIVEIEDSSGLHDIEGQLTVGTITNDASLGTSADGTDAGDDVTLNGTDGSSTNADSNILIEEAVALTTQTDYNTIHRMMGHMDDTAIHMFPNKFRLLNSSGTVLNTYHCAGTQEGVTT